ncbi:MAG: multiubiquitin domain-containing protein [Hyphomicrobiales bacterium]|nr:multiubiquitin domain-containing protein [Hyphomicrobiales bacterium]
MSTTTMTGGTSDKAGGSDLTAQIGNEHFNFQAVTFDDQKVTGAQVADAASAHPVENFIVLAQFANFELETLRPTELVVLNKVTRFFVIRGSGTDRFLVDGLNLEWPKKVLTGLTIKRLVGKDDDQIELVQELESEADRVIDDEDEVRIGAGGTEKFKTRPAKVDVTIIVNARQKKWEKKKISFDQVVKLAYPTPPAGQCIVYTVTFHNGPRANPEGTMVDGDTVKVKDGMVFNVQYTDKS